MSYDISDYKYGDGAQGALTVNKANRVINNYAAVVGKGNQAVTIGAKTNDSDGYGSFSAGEYVLIHVAACNNSASTPETSKMRGKFMLNKISSVSGSTLSLEKPFSDFFIDNEVFSALVVQVVTVPRFTNLKIPSGMSITCPQFNTTNGYGGIVAFLCNGKLTFEGGHIDLAGKGIPTSSTLWSKGFLPNENFGTFNKIPDRQSVGAENYRTKFYLPVNCPDGAVWARVNEMDCNENSRIGDTTKTGTAHFYGDLTYAGESAYLFGGSSIHLVAGAISNFNAKMIAKITTNDIQRGDHKGIARCYIATESVLPTDEALYAYDKISDPKRFITKCNFSGFGTGQRGTKSNITTQLNTYAAIVGMESNGVTFTLGERSAGVAKLSTPTGSNKVLVMIHLTSKGTYFGHHGEFWLANVLSVEESKMIIDKKCPFAKSLLNSYYWQVVAIPQYANFTLSGTNNNTPAFTTYESGATTYGYGGICAIAANNVLDLSGGKLLVDKNRKNNKASAYGAKGLKVIGNAQMCDRLPIGQGCGSVFLLANHLKMDIKTRIGAIYDNANHSGMLFGGVSRSTNSSNNNNSNTIVTSTPTVYDPAVQIQDLAGEAAGRTSGGRRGGNGGVGTGGGTGGDTEEVTTNKHKGGYGSNSPDGAAQGAHVFIAANEITGFSLAAICTGGEGGTQHSNPPSVVGGGNPGGAGCGGGGGGFYHKRAELYGGNGGFIGGGGGIEFDDGQWAGGGGSGAFCFVYCNKVNSQNLTNISSISS